MTPETSVVVVSYNNYDQTTGPCLESLVADSRSDPFEIVVVDNGSTEETVEHLCSAAADWPQVRLLLNRENRGFAGGNNDGVAAAAGRVVILLNSDTIVAPGSIGALSRILRENTAWDMLGPVTNEAGNEQKIHTAGQSPRKILEEGLNWCHHAETAPLPSFRLDFFCVAIAKNVYQALGGLDESFGPGYFEDTDFSIRASRAGLKMGVAEAVFVYHRGGQTFSRQGRDYVHRLMRANRRRLFEKHPGAVRLHHLRDCNLMVMELYAQQAEAIQRLPKEGLVFRFNNRWRIAQSLYPHGPLKRFGYRRRLSGCVDRFQRAMGMIA